VCSNFFYRIFVNFIGMRVMITKKQQYSNSIWSVKEEWNVREMLSNSNVNSSKWKSATVCRDLKNRWRMEKIRENMKIELKLCVFPTKIPWNDISSMRAVVDLFTHDGRSLKMFTVCTEIIILFGKSLYSQAH
jgi:hypothetical protein